MHIATQHNKYVIICTLLLVLILLLLTIAQMFTIHLAVVPDIMNGYYIMNGFF